MFSESSFKRELQRRYFQWPRRRLFEISWSSPWWYRTRLEYLWAKHEIKKVHRINGESVECFNFQFKYWCGWIRHVSTQAVDNHGIPLAALSTQIRSWLNTRFSFKRFFFVKFTVRLNSTSLINFASETFLRALFVLTHSQSWVKRLL